MPANPAKKKAAAAKPELPESSSEEPSSSEEEAEAKPQVKAKAKPKTKAKAAADESSSEVSSSEEEAEAKPKGKVTKAQAKAAKAEAKAKPKAKAAKDEESSSEEESSSGEEEEDAKPAAVFVPPPRPVFTPHTKMADLNEAQELEYCPTCGLPPDFCIHGPSWAKCQPWCLEKHPEYYPELCGVSLDEAKKRAAQATAAGAKVKELPGGKKAKSAEAGVTIKKLTRGGRKCVTSVAGLEAFGVDVAEVAKSFKKKFACGCAVVKGDPGQPDTVDIQGDFEQDVIDIMTEQFKIPAKKITLLESASKRGGKKPGRG